MTKIMRCDCTAVKNAQPGAQYQDVQYGKGMRVHNKRGSAVSTGKNQGTSKWVCTVCGKEK